ncbi:MAG: SUMF1/EgtB/PvdO family nonheme iron enzyme, partial [Gammaproteobacteria bacterium]
SMQTSAMEFAYVEGGVIEIGHQGDGFYFDNEGPRHQQLLKPYLIATRLVTNNEYEEFILAGGYEDPTNWLSDGWECVLTNQWKAPLYWKKINNKWYEFTLSGIKELNPDEPVAHVSYFEADAYAQWRNKRLPLEAEWENYVVHQGLTSNKGNFLEAGLYHPLAASLRDKKIPQQFFGDLWEWTASSYSPYPGYKTLAGALSEYNGKFMNNQFVLRGGSCATPQSHIRTTYRNFFQPNKRWQFSGIRLASTIE